MATLETIARNGACDGIVDQLNSGTLVFETAADGEVATLTFGNPAFGNAGAVNPGEAIMNDITADSSATGGIIEHASFYTSGVAKVLEATCGVGSGEIQMSSLSIGAGDTVDVTSLTVTVPAS